MELLQTIPWLSIHVTSVVLTILIVVIADLHGLWWLLGKVENLPKLRMIWFHHLIWLGLVSTIVAGGVMFSYAPEYYLNLTAFRLKILFVLALVINAWLIGKHISLTIESRFIDLTASQKKTLITSGLVSTIGWIGAIILAQFLS